MSFITKLIIYTIQYILQIVVFLVLILLFKNIYKLITINSVIFNNKENITIVQGCTSYYSFIEKTYDNTDLEISNISIKEVAYSLIATANKRAPIYNDRGIFVNTRPYNYNEIESTNNKQKHLIINNPLLYISKSLHIVIL